MNRFWSALFVVSLIVVYFVGCAVSVVVYAAWCGWDYTVVGRKS